MTCCRTLHNSKATWMIETWHVQCSMTNVLTHKFSFCVRYRQQNKITSNVFGLRVLVMCLTRAVATCGNGLRMVETIHWRFVFGEIHLSLSYQHSKFEKSRKSMQILWSAGSEGLEGWGARQAVGLCQGQRCDWKREAWRCEDSSGEFEGRMYDSVSRQCVWVRGNGVKTWGVGSWPGSKNLSISDGRVRGMAGKFDGAKTAGAGWDLWALAQLVAQNW